MTPPLAGLQVLELAGIGPAPYAVMLLADLGASVTRVDRVEAARGEPGLERFMHGVDRGRRSIAVDLKQPEGLDAVLRLADLADVFVEPFRPGVAERLGLGHDVLTARNERLVYVSVTAWGRSGPLAARASHDINIIAIAGLLHTVGDADRPPPALLSYLGDYAGGGLPAAVGILAALLERGISGRGQVIDVAMLDGAAALTTTVHGLLRLGEWSTERGANLEDGAAPFYRCYATADGRFVAVGAEEPQFYDALLTRLGLVPADWPQWDQARWPALREELAAVFATSSRDDWTRDLEGLDVCVTPVLSPTEAPEHPHNRARGTFVPYLGTVFPDAGPRLSRTPGRLADEPPAYGEHTDEVLAELGLTDGDVARLRAAGVVA